MRKVRHASDVLQRRGRRPRRLPAQSRNRHPRGGDRNGLPQSEPERTVEQSQVLTQEMEIVLKAYALSQQYPSAIAGS